MLYVTESVLNPQKDFQHFLDKTEGKDKTVNTALQASRISQTILKPKSITGGIIGKAAYTNPVSAVALKTLKIIKAVRRIIDTGIDI